MLSSKQIDRARQMKETYGDREDRDKPPGGDCPGGARRRDSTRHALILERGDFGDRPDKIDQSF